MKKSDLRKKYKDLRLNLSEEEIDELSLKIANNSLQLPIWSYDYFHIFLSISEQKEVNTEFLLHILQGKDKEVILPKTEITSGKLVNYLLTDRTVIKKNRWNIPEPQEGIQVPNDKLDVVFVPLLAFDKEGHRVGYGKGFYDKFLADCRPNILKIGLSFFGPVEKIKEIYFSDVPLNYCITPERVYNFDEK